MDRVVKGTLRIVKEKNTLKKKGKRKESLFSVFHTDATHGASSSGLIDEDDEEKKREFKGLEIPLNDSEAFELLNFIDYASLLTFYYVTYVPYHV